MRAGQQVGVLLHDVKEALAVQVPDVDVTFRVKREGPSAVRGKVAGDDRGQVCLEAEDGVPSLHVPYHNHAIGVPADRIAPASTRAAEEDVRCVAGKLADEPKTDRVIHVYQIVPPRNQELAPIRAEICEKLKGKAENDIGMISLRRHLIHLNSTCTADPSQTRMAVHDRLSMSYMARLFPHVCSLTKATTLSPLGLMAYPALLRPSSRLVKVSVKITSALTKSTITWKMCEKDFRIFFEEDLPQPSVKNLPAHSHSQHMRQSCRRV